MAERSRPTPPRRSALPRDPDAPPARRRAHEALTDHGPRNDIGQLKRCDPLGRDGTRLERSVKLYLPNPAGVWRMVFEITRDPTSDDLILAYLAFGLGHPDKPWHPSAYQVAHQRLHPGE